MLAGRYGFYCQPTNVASYHGSATYVILTRCRISHYKEQWMVLVADEVTVVANATKIVSGFAFKFAGKKKIFQHGRGLALSYNM